MISKQRLIDTLNEVRQQAVLGILIEPDCGICRNWCGLLRDSVSYDLVEELSVGWEHRTTSYSYPVPHDGSFGLWEGVNLEMRLSLIDHILIRLEYASQEYLDELYYD